MNSKISIQQAKQFSSEILVNEVLEYIKNNRSKYEEFIKNREKSLNKKRDNN